jgi:diaminohydroxyphosphoribosylaminopyrimidine deaminase / 5-amino-6-(5-phosphoribosylamino)uracil reductase
LKEEGLELNKRFFTFHTKKRPYIILKWAQSADGFLTKENDKQYWITGEPSRKTVHRWRSEEKGVLVGKNTVMIDNSKLNNRYFDIQKQPVRMIIDRGLEVADDFNVYDNSMRTIIFNNKTNKEANHTIWVKIPFEKVPQEICDELYKRNIQSLMVEGGAKTLQSFIEQNLWDEARIFTGKIKFETGIVAPVIQGNIISEEMLDNDKLQIVKNNITTLS